MTKHLFTLLSSLSPQLTKEIKNEHLFFNKFQLLLLYQGEYPSKATHLCIKLDKGKSSTKNAILFASGPRASHQERVVALQSVSLLSSTHGEIQILIQIHTETQMSLLPWILSAQSPLILMKHCMESHSLIGIFLMRIL